MTRPLPAAVADQIRPVPDDFTPTFETGSVTSAAGSSRYLFWGATLEVKDHGPVSVEIGYHVRKGLEDEGPAHLRASAWQATEPVVRYCWSFVDPGSVTAGRGIGSCGTLVRPGAGGASKVELAYRPAN